ncbi:MULTISPECIES: LysR family transcriptional regulator [Flammeovirga]|uniref:LysR family transcriptional regulator n=1 Tax=Flammeovirga agarivorans TaxID=2726742 RepID=A0A7X8SKZ8_9BACT|nr:MULTISPECIES: LysR family transcriptional regulator [Flammeovirga]NLR92184.1 LysR family transcriptional regulator [Flammeovirga agarivorans]
MNYTLHQLRVFLKVFELQSITKASEELFLTQPAVSIQLKKFQEQFKIPLTETIGRQLFFTEFGKEVVEICKNILGEADKFQSLTDQYNGLLTGKINISVVSTGKYVIPYFIQSFMKKYPQVELKIDVSNKLKVVESLERNATDFALVSVIPDNLELEILQLMENKLYLIGSADLSDKITTKKLSKMNMIFREQGSATRLAMEEFLEKRKLKYEKSIELVSNEAVKQTVNAGIGVSVMPLIGLKNELANGSLKVIPMRGLPIVTNWNFVYNKNKNLLPASAALIQHINEHREEIIDKYFSWAIDKR